MPLADPNGLTVGISTQYESGGIESAGKAVTGYVSQTEIATQKVREFASELGLEDAALMTASNEVVKASAAFENYTAKLDVAKQKAEQIATAQGTSSNAYYQAARDADNLGLKVDEASQKQDKAIEGQLKSATATEESSKSTQNLTGSIAGAMVVYQTLISTLQRVQELFSSSITAANQYEMAIAGLNSTARGMGDSSQQAEQAAQKLASDGLMPVTQSVTALRNLLQSGFSVPQATQLLDALKDKAVLGRQGYASLGDAVVAASKGIELGNSKTAEAAGNNEKLTTMLKNAGVATADLGNLQGSAAARQAILNGFIQNSADSLGNAARASDTFSAKQQAAATAIQNLQIQLGGVEQMVGGPLIQAFTTFLQSHQKLVIDLGLGAVAAVAFTAAIIGIGLAIQAVTVFLMAANPLMLAFIAIGAAIGFLLGDVVYHAVDNLQGKFKDYTKGLQDASGGSSGLTDQTNQLTKAQQDLQSKLEQIDDQISKNNRDFQESLATAIQGIQDKVASLNEQMAQENQSFAQSQAKKLDQFNQTEQSMADAHDKRIDTIQKSLDKERALGKWADQSKLSDLEQQLQDENDQYNQQLADKQKTYNQDVADAKASHDEKVSDLQKQLDTENDLLKKHAADVAAVQNVTMLDEIDKIKQTHDDQIASFADQKAQAVKQAAGTAQGIVQGFNDQAGNAKTAGSGLAKSLIDGMDSQSGNVKSSGNRLGTNIGDGLSSSLHVGLQAASKDMSSWFSLFDTLDPSKKGIISPSMSFDTNFLKNFSWDKTLSTFKSAAKDFANFAGAKATGGPVAAGQSYLVGDNPDGSINSTTEMFVPSQSGTILSAPQTRTLLAGSGGRGGVTINQTNHVYNQVDMNAANLDLGWRLVNA